MIDQIHPCNPSLRLHPEMPEPGEWVKFSYAPDPTQPTQSGFFDGPRGFKFFNGPMPADAHKCPEGHFVGIYVPTGHDARGEFVAAHIAVVDVDGDNLTHKGQNVRLGLAWVKDLHPLEPIDHIPATRINKTLAEVPDMQTKAYLRRRRALLEKARISGAQDEAKFVADELARLYASGT